jgi:hypothetical protein
MRIILLSAVAACLLLAGSARAETTGLRPFPASGPSWNVKEKLDWQKLRGHVVLLDFFNRH